MWDVKQQTINRPINQSLKPGFQYFDLFSNRINFTNIMKTFLGIFMFQIYQKCEIVKHNDSCNGNVFVNHRKWNQSMSRSITSSGRVPYSLNFVIKLNQAMHGILQICSLEFLSVNQICKQMIYVLFFLLFISFHFVEQQPSFTQCILYSYSLIK